jgi:hypothetical protein
MKPDLELMRQDIATISLNAITNRPAASQIGAGRPVPEGQNALLGAKIPG